MKKNYDIIAITLLASILALLCLIVFYPQHPFLSELIKSRKYSVVVETYDYSDAIFTLATLKKFKEKNKMKSLIKTGSGRFELGPFNNYDDANKITAKITKYFSIYHFWYSNIKKID
jgi:hypothetical protein